MRYQALVEGISAGARDHSLRARQSMPPPCPLLTVLLKPRLTLVSVCYENGNGSWRRRGRVSTTRGDRAAQRHAENEGCGWNHSDRLQTALSVVVFEQDS